MQIFFQNSLPVENAIIETDREKILTILSNLINNAIKYSDVGTIEIGYTVKQSGKTVVMSDINLVELIHGKSLDKAITEPVELEFFVKDTGLGIPKDKLKVIFDRFIQDYNDETRVFQGAGLGLAISKAYVEMLGGKIWVESETGKGSTFFFTIPFNDKPEIKTVLEKDISTNGTEIKIKKLKILSPLRKAFSCSFRLRTSTVYQ